MRFRNALNVFGLVATLAIAGCSTTSTSTPEVARVETSEIFTDSYGQMTDAGYALPAIPIQKVKPEFHRQIVNYDSNERAGTIIVNARRYALLGKQLTIYRADRISWSIWLYKDIGFQGMVHTAPTSPYMTLLAPFLANKCASATFFLPTLTTSTVPPLPSTLSEISLNPFPTSPNLCLRNHFLF